MNNKTLGECVYCGKSLFSESIHTCTPKAKQEQRKCDNCGEFGGCCQQPKQEQGEQHARDAITWTPETGYVFKKQEQGQPAPVQEPMHPDDIAVNLFATAMKFKLAKQRTKGYGGWDDKEKCPTERLQRMLVDHIVKGDPVDVGNFAMMLWNRGDPVAAKQDHCEDNLDMVKHGEPTRHELQAKGEHPAPCARFCEATAFRIAERGFHRRIDELTTQLKAQQKREPVACLDCGSNNVGIPANYDSLISSVKTKQDHPIPSNSTVLENQTHGDPVADAATVAGLRASICILSNLVNQQRKLLVEVEDVCGRDGHGGPLEDGESDLIDRVRVQIAAIAPPAAQPSKQKQDVAKTPNKKHEPTIDLGRYAGTYGGYITDPKPAQKPQFKEFIKWAGSQGYDCAQTCNSDTGEWIVLNPMTADLWKAWQAAHGIKEVA